MPETAFILIVDGDSEEAESLAESLRKEAHACRVVESASQPLKASTPASRTSSSPTTTSPHRPTAMI